MTNLIRILLIAGTIFGVTWAISTLKDNDSPAPKAAIAGQVPPIDTRSIEKPLSATETASKRTAMVLTDAEAQTAKDFEARVADYAAIHQKLKATLPALSDNATPEQIDQHQRSMVALIQEERKNAKPGEFFTPGMVTLVKRASAATVGGPDGKENKASIMDENPGTLPNVNVNDRYPEGVPVSSMPTELLESLPKLGENLEYRFLGKRLVLLDTSCQIVLDLTENVLP